VTFKVVLLSLVGIIRILIGGVLMADKVKLECTECKNRNYDTTKNKRTHQERIELKKYCPFCKKHTVHRETK